jgi:hypothetical protein
MQTRGVSLVLALAWTVLVSLGLPSPTFAESENSRTVKRSAGPSVRAPQTALRATRISSSS